LENKTEIEVGKTQIELPHFMAVLKKDFLDRVIKSEKSHEKIIACGLHPEDKKVTIVTGVGSVLIFDPSKFFIPEGPYVPHPNGEKVVLINENGRWVIEEKYFELPSAWLIKNSTSALQNAKFQVGPTYVGEIDIEGAEIHNS